MLQVQNISFSYHKTPVLADLSFEVDKGELLTVIGESGSGKSTLLKLLFGEYDLDAGHVYWNNKEIRGPKFNLVVGYDFMKYVAQEFDLMPFISVEENIGKHLSNFFPDEKIERTKELLEVVELSAFAKSKVKTLSGGQKQRVALARAIAKQPEIILLDEPFSHIDNFKKQSLRRSLFKYLKDNNITCIVATHDKDDVLGYADNMMVLDHTKIIAKASPEELFKQPKTPLVASFFGEFSVINNQIVYAHQLKIVPQSDLEVYIKRCFFKGHCFLVESTWNNTIIFFESDSQINIDECVSLKVIK